MESMEVGLGYAEDDGVEGSCSGGSEIWQGREEYVSSCGLVHVGGDSGGEMGGSKVLLLWDEGDECTLQ